MAIMDLRNGYRLQNVIIRARQWVSINAADGMACLATIQMQYRLRQLSGRMCQVIYMDGEGVTRGVNEKLHGIFKNKNVFFLRTQ